MGRETYACEKCGEDCCRDEVDVGVGVIHGPWGCPCCGWSEDSRYDSSSGPSPKQLELGPNWYVDSRGGARRLKGVANDS